MLLRVVVHARAVQVADVIAAPRRRVVDVAVGPPEIAEGLRPVLPPPQLERVIDRVPRLVAEVHQHFLARVLEQVIVHQLPQLRIREVPGDVDADGAVRRPEIVVAEVVARHEGDPLALELADHLFHALRERPFRAKVQIADPRCQ